ncbi:MAG: DUF3575 domain-containing protein [Tannerellaceae bacterium]|nr:DUF3575 domain-containing protein [Tannerellaceae bacterium]
MRDYRTNSGMLDALDSLMRDPRITDHIDTIKIYGACSPVGSEKYNDRLALRRAQAMRGYLVWKYPAVANAHPIKIYSLGIDHAGYRALKGSGMKLTEKQLWNLLQYTSVRLHMTDGSYIHPGAESPMQAIVENQPEMIKQMSRDTVFVHLSDTVYTRNTIYVQSNDTVFTSDQSIFGSTPRKPLWLAVKTNMLYDAVLLPNLTFEAWLGRNWSVAVEGYFSWWSSGSSTPPDSQRHRVQAAGLEMRRWFFSPGPLRGHAIGLYGTYFNYDLRLFPKDETSTGQLSYGSFSAGLSYAYSFSIGRRLNLELGAAFGYAGGNYYDYDYCLQDAAWEPADRMRKSFRQRSYWGPTRIGVSLVWLLGASNAGKQQKEK